MLMALLPIVTIVTVFVCVFTFVAVVSWADNRRRERESFHRHETYRKMIEHSDQNSQQVLALMREEEARAARRAREGLILAGLITTATGIGCVIFFGGIVQSDRPIYLIGVIPLLVGIVLSVYGYFMAPRPGPSGSSSESGSMER
jgi:hypothetical protein